MLKAFKNILVLVLVCLFVFCSCKFPNTDFYIFNTMSDLEAITIDTEAKITKYSNPKEDKHFTELTYTDYFGCEYSSDKIEFTIFAYEFDNKATADIYYKNVTGKTNEHITAFSDVSGMSEFRRIVIHNNKAYSIYCSVNQSEEVLNFIKTYLPEKLEIVKNTTSNS